MSGGHCQCRDCQKNTGTGHSSHWCAGRRAQGSGEVNTTRAQVSSHAPMQVTAFTHLRQSPEKR